MYFASRQQAGRQLAAQLKPKYRFENCAVVALNEGGAQVGMQIAAELHCVLMMLLSEAIELPREPGAIAGITADGVISYNSKYSDGEMDEMLGEYRNLVEQEKLIKMHQLNELLGDGGLTNKEMLKGHTVILVSDGMKDGFELDMAIAFMKPIETTKIVVAVPLASVSAVDRMHIFADQIFCLSVVEDYMETPHYYDTQDVPTREAVVKIVQNMILNWK